MDGGEAFRVTLYAKKGRSIGSLQIPRMGMPFASNIPQDAIKQKAQSLGSLDALRRAQGVQSVKSQIVGFLKPRFHCTTLRSVNR